MFAPSSKVAGLKTRQYYNSVSFQWVTNNATNWSIPSGVTSVLVKCWGGGGASVTGTAGSSSNHGNPGGGGGFAKGYISVVSGGNCYINIQNYNSGGMTTSPWDGYGTTQPFGSGWYNGYTGGNSFAAFGGQAMQAQYYQSNTAQTGKFIIAGGGGGGQYYGAGGGGGGAAAAENGGGVGGAGAGAGATRTAGGAAGGGNNSSGAAGGNPTNANPNVIQPGGSPAVINYSSYNYWYCTGNSWHQICNTCIWYANDWCYSGYASVANQSNVGGPWDHGSYCWGTGSGANCSQCGSGWSYGCSSYANAHDQLDAFQGAGGGAGYAGGGGTGTADGQNGGGGGGGSTYIGSGVTNGVTQAAKGRIPGGIDDVDFISSVAYGGAAPGATKFNMGGPAYCVIRY
jgi:hypothetical protein